VDLQVAKWGNSLALRIPAELVQRLGLHEGATVQAQLTVDGALSIRPAHSNREAFALELTGQRNAMPMAGSVIQEWRWLRCPARPDRRSPSPKARLAVPEPFWTDRHKRRNRPTKIPPGSHGQLTAWSRPPPPRQPASPILQAYARLHL